MTLVELLAVMVCGVVLLGAVAAFVIVSIDQENAVSSRTVAARNAEVALSQLVRDLRQAMATDASGNPLHVTVTSSGSATTFAFSIPTPGSNATPQALTWTCQGTIASPGYCWRRLGSGGSAARIVGFEGIAFTDASGAARALPITDPNYLGIAMTLGVTSQLDTRQYAGSPANLRASSPITVQTGVDLRNLP